MVVLFFFSSSNKKIRNEQRAKEISNKDAAGLFGGGLLFMSNQKD